MTDRNRAKPIDGRTAQHVADVVFGQGWSEVTGLQADGTIEIQLLTPSDTWSAQEWAEFDEECGGEA